MPSSDLKTFTEGEIDMLLSGDRREVDKLLLHGINALSEALIPSLGVISELGDTKGVRARIAWIDCEIEKQRVRTNMMRKVSESLVIWAAIAFVGFLVLGGWNYTVEIIRTKMGVMR